GTRRSIALAEQVFGRVPAAVLGQKLRYEFREGVCILIDAEKSLLLVLTRNAAEAGARCVDKDQVRGIQQARGVVGQRVRRRGGMGIRGGDDAARPEGSQ